MEGGIVSYWYEQKYAGFSLSLSHFYLKVNIPRSTGEKTLRSNWTRLHISRVCVCVGIHFRFRTNRNRIESIASESTNEYKTNIIRTSHTIRLILRPLTRWRCHWLCTSFANQLAVNVRNYSRYIRKHFVGLWIGARAHTNDWNELAFPRR